MSHPDPITSVKPYTTISQCRLCGCKTLLPVVNFGNQFVSDFVEKDKVYAGVRCPIEIVICQQCTLVQQLHTAPQDFLYTRHYWYRSGTTDTMKVALQDVVNAAIACSSPKPGDVVLDIGSNDGTLLRCYPHRYRLRTVGVEPALNMKEEGSRGVDVFVNEFWDARKVLPRVNDDRAKIITAIGMFYDLEDPNKFIADVATVLHPDGVFIAQLMCLKQTMEKRDIGNFAHEHLEFYTLKSLHTLFFRNGLEIFDVEENDINGGSYRLYVRHIGSTVGRQREKLGRLETYHAIESMRNLGTRYVLAEIFKSWNDNRAKCLAFIADRIMDGKRVYVYGASTKGNVILQWLGLTGDDIPVALDKSKEKWGKYTAGSGIHIVSEEAGRGLLSETIPMPDYMLVLPYAFVDEFVERESQQEWRKRGGRFIVPLPEFRVL